MGKWEIEWSESYHIQIFIWFNEKNQERLNVCVLNQRCGRKWEGRKKDAGFMLCRIDDDLMISNEVDGWLLK